jgi:hypothetical protein
MSSNQCTICSHLRRGAIDKALLAGEPGRSVATKEGVGRSSLARHSKHIGQAIVLAAQRRGERLGDGLLEQQRTLKARGLRLLDDAEREQDGRLRAVAIALARENIIAEAKLVADARSAGLDGQRFELVFVDWRTGERILETFEKPDLGNAQLVESESLGKPTFSFPTKASAEIVVAAVATAAPESIVVSVSLLESIVAATESADRDAATQQPEIIEPEVIE